MARPCSILIPACLGLAFAGLASASARSSYARVDAAPMRTSVYVASVLLTPGPFVRTNGVYVAEYTAEVFPFSFYSENGSLRIAVSDGDLDRLSRGLSFAFEGRAIRSDGRERRIDGRVTPLGPATGRIRVRLVVNRYLILVFDTTYRLPSG